MTSSLSFSLTVFCLPARFPANLPDCPSLFVLSLSPYILPPLFLSVGIINHVSFGLAVCTSVSHGLSKLVSAAPYQFVSS